MIEKSFSWTARFLSRTNVLNVQLGVSKPFVGDMPSGLETKVYRAIWDTGASASVITAKIARELGMLPIGKTSVSTANGSAEQNVYLVNVFLPNNVVIPNVRVTEANLSPNLDALIGMDIIGLGDFSVTHFDGKTMVSFRMPSCAEIDYVKDFNDHMNAKAQQSVPPAA